MLRSLYVGLVTLFLLLLSYIPSRAGDILGADITYKIIGKDSVQVIVDVYTDCNGKDITATPIKVTPDCGSPFTVNTAISTGVDITPVCSRSSSRCSNSKSSFPFGVKMVNLIAIVNTGPSKCCNFTFSYDACCWSKTIITGAGGENFYIECKYTKCIVSPHNSPYHISLPATFLVHKGETIFMGQNVADVERGPDTFVYKLAPVLRHAGDTIAYNPPYSYKEPLDHKGGFGNTSWDSTKASGFLLDPTTGYLGFTATKKDVVTTYQIITEEYTLDSSGKYKLIGTIARCLSITVLDSVSNHPPEINGNFDGDGVQKVIFETGRGREFKIFTSDPDPNDSITVTWDHALASLGGTFLVDDPTVKHPVAEFAWSPQEYRIRSTPYIFTVTVIDNACPVPGRRQRSYAIYVRKHFPYYLQTTTNKGCGSYHFSVVGDTSSHLHYAWSIDSSTAVTDTVLNYQFKTNGKHLLHFRVANKDTSRDVYDSIIVKGIANVDAGQNQTICLGDSVQLHGSSTERAYYVWSAPVPSKSIHLPDPYVKPTHDQWYYLTVYNDSACTATDSVFIKVLSPSAYKIHAPSRFCKGDTTTLSVSGRPEYKYLWHSSTGMSRINDSTISIYPSASRYYYIAITDTLHHCTRQDSVWIRIGTPASYTLSGTATICAGDTATLSASGKAPYTYAWTTGKDISKLNDSTVQVYPKTSKSYTVTITDTASGCTKRDSIFVQVNSPHAYKILAPVKFCSTDTVTLSITGKPQYKYSWQSGSHMNRLTDSSIQVYPATSQYYYVKTSDTLLNCSITDSVLAKIDDDCVWPGDANNDKIVDYKDMLALSVGVGSSGNARSIVSPAWKGHQVADWSSSLTGGINYKHLDCNGDGSIDVTDTVAIHNNYGYSHSKRTDGLNDRSGNPPFYFAFDKEYYLAGDTVHAALYLGSQAQNVSAMGAGMKYSYGNSFMLPGTYRFVFGTALLQTALSTHSMYHADGNSSTAQGAIVRFDHTASNGYGKIADISYVLKDSTQTNYTPKGDSISLDMLQQLVIDIDGKPVKVDAGSASTAVYRSKRYVPAGIAEAASILSSANIYPNPFGHQFTLELRNSKYAHITVSCYDALGRKTAVLLDKSMNADIHTFEFSDADAGISQAGMYFIQVRVADQVSVLRLVKMQ